MKSHYDINILPVYRLYGLNSHQGRGLDTEYDLTGEYYDFLKVARLAFYSLMAREQLKELELNAGKDTILF